MDMTDEAGPDKPYRLVFDTKAGTAAGSPTTDRQQALAEFDQAVTQYAAHIAAGELRISVLPEDVWAQRGGR